jgi:MFS family permease
MAVATGFALVLLPYSLLGPFVGTILDRFHRRNVLLAANLGRSALLLAIAVLVARGTSETLLIPWVLAGFGMSRLVLAGLSAGLPRLVPADLLVPANAIAVTGGTLASVIGGGLGLGIRRLTSDFASDTSDAAIVALAALAYLLAALSALRLRPVELGPEDHERVDRVAWHLGLEAVHRGLAHLRQHARAGWAIARIAMVRGGMSALIVMTILLQRNTFHSDPDDAIAALAVVVTVMGIGSLFGAAITPRATMRWSRLRWMRINMVIVAGLVALFPLLLTPVLLPIGMMAIAASAQAIKVSADAEVQLAIDDDFRGRVFAVYDMSVNISIVTGAFLAAALLPEGGRSTLVPLIIASIVAIAGLVERYRWRSAHHSRSN